MKDRNIELYSFCIDVKNQAREASKQLAATNSFILAPWRRKVKLIQEEASKVLSSNSIFGFNWYYRTDNLQKIDKKERGVMLSLRADVFNIFLEPIRAKVDSNGWAEPSAILLTSISNKQGSFLTRVARRKCSYFLVEDLFQANDKINTLTKEKRNINFTEIPINPRPTNTSSWAFWEGFDYCEKLLKTRGQREK